MRITVDGLIFGRQRVGGISRMWCEWLRRLPDAGVDVDLVLPLGAPAEVRCIVRSNRPAVRAIHDPFFWPKRYFERTAVRAALLNRLYVPRKCRLFHSTYFSTLQRRGVQTVVSLYDMILERLYADSPNPWVHWGIAIKRRSLENADCIAAISEHTRRDLLDVYPHIPPQRVVVVPLGVAPPPAAERAAAAWETVRRGIPWAAGEYLLYIGNREGYKNFALLPRLARLDQGLRFICVGGEDPRMEEARLREAGLADRFRFLPSVRDDGLAALYRHARAAIVPSLCEGFGLPVLEAMAQDCPVLCADASSLPEVGGAAAFYFDPRAADTALAALSEMEKRERSAVVAGGRENAARFTWEESVRRMVAIYREMI